MKDGGPAFPVLKQHNNGYVSQVAEGMTLLDWFAGMAMQSALVDAHIPGIEADPIAPEAAHWLGVLAKASYRVADAMIQERSKT
jgi:hypothetical protein